MKVIQSVMGKFHHFDLARQLHRQGMLEAIFTGYPRWKLRGEQLPQEKIRTFPWLMVPMMGKWSLGILNPRLDRELQWWVLQTLDSHVARNIPECDVFVGISGVGLRTSTIVRRRGGAYICDRGSTHIRFADQILKEEFQRWGQQFQGVDPRIIAKEEEEYATADRITLPSGFCVRSFLEMGVPANRIRKVSYGVDLSRFQQSGVPPQDGFEVLFVGQVSFRKGVPYLLNAFQRFRHPRKRLRIVGAMQPEMREFLRGRHYDQVEFLGSVPQASLPSLMSKSHVMVLPSVEDGLGLVLGQAMACGCPLICSTNTGGEDLFQDGREGFVVPIRNPNAIETCFESFAGDSNLRARMSAACLERVKAIGGWGDYGEAYAGVLRDLCESRSTPQMVQPVTRREFVTLRSD